MFNKTIDEFIKELEGSSNIEKEEIKQILLPFKRKLFRSLNVDEMIAKSYDEEKLLKYIEASPGFTFNFKTNNIDIKLYGGRRNLQDKPILENTLFDMASITKTYTMLIIYKLFELKIISPVDKVRDIVNYPNLGDIRINELIYFSLNFKTHKRIDEAETRLEALDTLHNVKATRCLYNYNDIGCMILKEIAEKVTNTTYEELLNTLILGKLGCKETFAHVPEYYKNNITGSANIEKGLCNDAKAIMLGGNYGHAGIFASSKDLNILLRALINGKIVNPYDFYTPNIIGDHALVGNIWSKGSHNVDERFPKKSICVQGSTRVQANVSEFELNKKYTLSSTVLLNPATISKEEALKKESSINSKMQPGTKIKIYKEFDGFKQIDARNIMPVNETMIPLNKEVSNVMLRLLYIEYIISKYEKVTDFNKEVKKILVRK